VAGGIGHSVGADWPELFKRTAEILGGKAKAQLKLLQFLLGQDRHVASFEKIVTDSNRQKPLPDHLQREAARVARRLAERLRENLNERGCPLRLEIKDSAALLIKRDPS
jgi:hypothetical protein